MDQRVAFMADWLRDEWTMTELAARYGISRKTAYKWVDRYEADPEHGLAERSRAPQVHGRAMADDDARRRFWRCGGAHPHWGPKKLRAVLASGSRTRAWPAASTMGDLLRREGLSQPRRRRAVCRAADAAVGGGATRRMMSGRRTSKAGFGRRMGRGAIR